MLQPAKAVLFYGLGLLASIAVFHIIVFGCWPYAELARVIALFNAERYWLQNLNVYSLSRGTYMLAKAGYIALFIVALASLYFLKFRLSAFWPGTLISLAGKFVKVWAAIPRAEKLIFILTGIGLFLARAYFLGVVDIHLDESSNYLWFLRKGLPGVIMYYPIPNNHVLYSLLCLAFKQVFANGFWVLKLPAFLLSCISTGLFYLALRSVFPFLISYVATFGLSFSYYALYFSVYGRGYFLMLICYFLAFTALLKLTEKKEAGYWLVFLVATVAGFYTIPVFIYPFAPLFLFGLFTFIYTGNKTGALNLLAITFFAAIATLLLYVPIMLVSGPHMLFGNMYVTQALATETYLDLLPGYVVFMQGTLLGQETIGFAGWLLASFCLVIFGVYRKRFRRLWLECGFALSHLLLVFLSGLMPWALMALQKVYPPERVWLFKALPDFLILAFCLQVVYLFVFRKKARYLLGICAGLILIYGSYEVTKLYRRLPQISGKASSGMGTVVKDKGQQTQQDKPGNALKSRFLLYERNAAGEVKLITDKGKRDKSKEYDLILLDRQDPDSLFFDRRKTPLLFSTREIRVFGK